MPLALEEYGTLLLEKGGAILLESESNFDDCFVSEVFKDACGCIAGEFFSNLSTLEVMGDTVTAVFVEDISQMEIYCGCP